jgi:hypothetical protein
MLFHGDVWQKNTYILQTNFSLWFKTLCLFSKKVPLCLAWWDFFLNSRIGKMFWEKIN